MKHLDPGHVNTSIISHHELCLLFLLLVFLLDLLDGLDSLINTSGINLGLRVWMICNTSELEILK